MKKQNNKSSSKGKIFDKKGERELGFGKHILTKGRMMNSDGSFNVFREVARSMNDIYFQLIRLDWMPFLGLIVLTYLIVNCIFALGYVALDVNNLSGIESRGLGTDFQEAFFFSTQTLTTVGYGRISPVGFGTNALASFESLVGLMSFALISGLLYGRFSRPVARIIFSDKMLLSPYRGGRGLMLRIMNGRKSELLNMEAQLMIAYNEYDENGKSERRFHRLNLELNTIAFFTMSWTLVHGLDEKSPIRHLKQSDYLEGNAEFLVLLRGTDEATEQIVTARKSYITEELVWGACFLPAILGGENNIRRVIASKIGAYESSDLPTL